MLILTGVRPAFRAASIPARASPSMGLPAIRSYRSGSIVSSETLTRLSPASLSSCARSASMVAFVVSEISIPGGTDRMICARSGRIRGSPPVNLTDRIPKDWATRRISAICSAESSCSGFFSPSAWQ